MAIGTFGLAFLAGLLSVLSPCVLPLLPIVLGAAAIEHLSHWSLETRAGIEPALALLQSAA